MKYEALYKYTLEHGGVTVRIKDNIMPKKGFAVGGAGITLDAEVGDLEGFDIGVERTLKYNTVFATSEAEYLGTWIHDGRVFIDLVDVFASKDFALGVAFERGELAIYDLEKGREIPIKRKKA